jgi:hypothetical protein
MKYRQRGYRDSEKKQEKDRDRHQEREDRDAARQVRHGMQRTASVVMRCADCGHQTSGQIEVLYDTECDSCKSALHNCRNCASFDTGSRFECRQEIPKRIPSKTAGNFCDLYEPRAVLDATGTRADTKAPNPRDAFDDLFKK